MLIKSRINIYSVPVDEDAAKILSKFEIFYQLEPIFFYQKQTSKLMIKPLILNIKHKYNFMLRSKSKKNNHFFIYPLSPLDDDLKPC